MYSWGGDPIDWRGKTKYDFGSARARYDSIAAKAGSGPRVYAAINAPDMGLVDPKGKTIKSESENPVVIGIDGTGSMNVWPMEIFDRLPLLYQTLSKYKENTEFSFGVIGDANSDGYPLQVNEFGKGLDLEKKLNALYAEGGGGGQISESYELFGYYMLKHCETPKATSPFLLIFGDEKFYPEVNPKQVRHYIGDSPESALSSRDVWSGLLQKFNVYYLQKPYGTGDKSVTADVCNYWADVLGKQRVIKLPSMERAVDIAMGLIAKQWGEYEDFGKSLDARHDDPNIKASVHHSLRHIPGLPSPASVMSGSKKSRVTKSLLD